MKATKTPQQQKIVRLAYTLSENFDIPTDMAVMAVLTVLGKVTQLDVTMENPTFLTEKTEEYRLYRNMGR